MLKNPFIKDSVTNQYQTLINQINALENSLKPLTDTELRNKTFQLKKQYQQEQDLDALIAQSFAITREASLRTLGLRHFDVQLLGGLVLNSGKISEMRTGEGKIEDLAWFRQAWETHTRQFHHGMTPYEAWYGRRPDVTFLKTFGSKVCVRQNQAFDGAN